MSDKMIEAIAAALRDNGSAGNDEFSGRYLAAASVVEGLSETEVADLWASRITPFLQEISSAYGILIDGQKTPQPIVTQASSLSGALTRGVDCDELGTGHAHVVRGTQRELEHLATSIIHAYTDIAVSTFVDGEGVPVVQIDPDVSGRIRINLNDAPVWDGDPEKDDAPGAHYEADGVRGSKVAWSVHVPPAVPANHALINVWVNPERDTHSFRCSCGHIDVGFTESRFAVDAYAEHVGHSLPMFDTLAREVAESILSEFDGSSRAAFIGIDETREVGDDEFHTALITRSIAEFARHHLN